VALRVVVQLMGGGFLSGTSGGGEDCHGHRMLEWEDAEEVQSLAKTRDLHEVRRAVLIYRGHSQNPGQHVC